MSRNGKRSASSGKRQTYNPNQQVGAYRPAYTPGKTRKDSGVSYVNEAAQYSRYRNANANPTVQPAVSGVGKHARNASQYSAKKSHRGRNIAIAVALIFVVLLVGVGSAAALYLNSLNNDISFDDEETAAAVDASLEPEVSGEPFYAMIIGSDTRNDGEGQRSDTNIVARIDPDNATITLISIPRDTAINYGSYGMVKFNAAYNYDGAAGTIQAAENLLGVKISHYVEIDFQGLIDLVDAVGGVEVDVPMKIEDADAGGTVEAGQQTLDGEHALIFARSRSYDSGDFQRSTNQRLLVEAFVEKVLSLPATELPGLVKQAAQSISTDMSLTDIIGYAQKFQNADSITIYSCLIPSTTEDIDEISYVVCDEETLAEMMAVIDEGGDPSTVTQDSTVSSSEEAEENGVEGIPIYVETDKLQSGEATYEEVYGYSDGGYTEETYIDDGSGDVYYSEEEYY